LIPLSFSVLAGSFVSMIGTSTNLTVQGLMQADRGYSFSFFAPAPIGVPLFVVLLIYQLIFGPLMLPNDKTGLIREVKDKASNFIAEVLVSEHSPAVGRSVGALMNSLGLSPSQAIKIRRKKVQNSLEKQHIEDEKQGVEANNGLNKVVKISSTHWFKALVDPTLNHIEYESLKLISDENENEEYLDIVTPSRHEVINAGDIVYMASAVDAVKKMLKSVAGESLGLFIFQSNVLAMPVFATEFVECVVSDSNPLIGQKMSQVAKKFPEIYKATVITVRPKNWGNVPILNGENHEGDTLLANAEHHVQPVNVIEDVTTGDIELANFDGSSQLVDDKAISIVVSDHVLGAGDLVLAVCPEGERDNMKTNGDFYVVSTVDSLPKPMNLYTLIPLILFMLMLSLVAAQFITMIAATLVATALFFLCGWVKAEEIPKLVDLRLCMLLACSISFARGVTESGLAITIAETLTSGISSAFSNLLLMNFMTIIMTELISNNAAAALMYPIAVATADKLGVDFKPFAMGVLIGSTAGFANPCGTF
jgi:di/tricarboxylate transporter